MVTLKQVRDDLKEIRYYYSRKEIFEQGGRIVGDSVGIVEKAKRYNSAVKNAPTRLYDLYISLYLQNRTQNAFSSELGYSPEYVYQMNRKLCEYLVKYFNGEK